MQTHHPWLLRCFGSLLAIAAAACAHPGQPGTGENSAGEASARQLLHRYHVEVWNAHDLGAVDALLSPDFFSHASAPGAARGPAGPMAFLEGLFKAFPDLTSSEDLLISEGDLAVVRWTIRATHAGPYLGREATGRRIEVSGMDILRARDGRLVEHWGGIGDQFPAGRRTLITAGAPLLPCGAAPAW